MHQLILLRHAKAARETEGISDHDRKLTSEGRRDAGIIGKAMRKAGLNPDVVLVSSSRRTLETLDALEPWDDRPNIETLTGLYLATQGQILESLRDLPETVRSVLVIGHNPGLHELALRLTGTPPLRPEMARLAESYPTAGLAEFLVTTLWRKLGPGAAALQRFLIPADLR